MECNPLYAICNSCAEVHCSGAVKWLNDFLWLALWSSVSHSLFSLSVSFDVSIIFCSTAISSSEFPPLALETLCQTLRTSNMPIYVHGCKVVKWLCVLGNHFIYVKKNSEQIVKVWWSHNFKFIRTASLRTLICEHLFVHPIELILSISQYYRLPF